MKLVKIFFILLFSLSLKVNSNELVNHLNEFFKKEYSLNSNNFKIIVQNALKKNKICKKPYFLLSNNSYNLSLFDVLYICGKQHEFLKVALEVKGEYIIANKKILRGTKIQESDLKVVTGRLDKLPNGTYLKKENVINRVNLRDILPFEPITSFITRLFWIVISNQEVTVKFKGKNFEIITTGKALNNGGIKEKIRVKTKNNKIFTGIINENGEVVVAL